MLLEVVRSSVEESIELGKVGSILGLTIRLRTVVSMTVNINVLFSVSHVLTVIDLIELTLAISELPSIGCTNVSVLAEVRSDERSI